MDPTTTPTEFPLAEASRRLKPPRKKQRNSTLTATEQGMAMGMAVVGVPQKKIAQALEVPLHVVEDQLVAIPNYKQTILAVREKLKLTKIQKAWAIEGKLWALAEKLADAEDAKGVDGTLRALHASEKIQQAVAGEGQRVEVTTTQPPVDLKVLIQNILHDDLRPQQEVI